MKIPKTIFYLVKILFLPILVSCAPNINIPKSSYPLEIEREFYASFDKTWDAVLEVIKMLNGTIIMQDKYLGLISFGISNNQAKSKTYMNVYIKSKPPNTTVVYLTIRDRTGKFIKSIEPSLKEVDKDFFDKLDKLLGGI